jgi:hypothetical protein
MTNLTKPQSKAHVNAAGEIVLVKGQDYFIDVGQEDDFLKAYPYLTKMPLAIGKSLKSDRGPIMAAFRAKENIAIPNYVARLTGEWFLNEGPKPLNEIQRKLYGDMYDSPQDGWEYLADKFPDMFDFSVQAAEGVKNIKSNLETTVKFAVGAAIAAVFIGVIIYSVRKSGPSSSNQEAEDDEEESPYDIGWRTRKET